MAKFSVGEIALATTINAKYGYSCGITFKVEILAIPGMPMDALDRNPSFKDYAVRILDDGSIHGCIESCLKKLPPDDHADTRDTTEDPGLTRLKRVLEQDVAKVKRPEKV